MAALDALAQRIVVRAHMRGLTRAETAAYFEHQLGHAGCKHPIFESSAIEAIYQATSGLPRRTNLLAHHALLAAAIAKANNVSAEHVQAALNELA
jgi:general secretion pathway protein A